MLYPVANYNSTIIKKILLHIRRKFLKKFSPKMIHGYKRELDGKFLPLTRVSNSTFIDYPHKFEIENNVYVGIIIL